MMNATTEYFIMTHATESDIIEFSERLEHDLSAIGINVIDKPNYKDQESVIDENSLEHIIRRKIKYSNDGALIRDIDSISAIVRLRQGRISHDIEKCHAIFVSPNNALAHASRRFFAAEYAGWSVPVCITDYELTNLLWVKRPLSAPDLPRKKILADIYAAMQPETSNPQVFADYVKELNKQRDRRQITPEEYANLRYRMESKRAFMDVTLGEKEVLTEGSIAEILVLSDKRMRAEAQKEAVEYAAKAILDARATHQAEQEVISARLAKEETERKTAEEGAGKIQEERLARNTNIKMRASRWSRRTIFVLEVIAAIITLVGTAVTFPWMDLGFGQLSSFFKAGFSVTWFLLVALGFLNLFYGTAVKPYLDGLECWLAKKIEEILHNLSS